MLSVCLTECWPPDMVGKAAELGTNHSGFGVIDRFLLPFKAASVDVKGGGSNFSGSS